MEVSYMYWKFVFLSSCFCYSYDIVHLKVVEKEIRLGIPFDLSCEILSNVTIGSRKWFGGKDGSILILNGISSNSAKYIEIRESSRKYLLRIAELDENDLNCTYACRFGFLTDEMFLMVNKFNFKYLPKVDETHVKYVKTNDSYSLQVRLDKVFPVPSCKVKTRFKSRKLTFVDKKINGIFYAVQFSDQSTESFHACDSPVEIECTIKDSRHTFSHLHSVECSAFHSTSSKTSNGTHIGTVIGIVIAIVVLIALIIVVIYKKVQESYRCSSEKDQQTSTQLCVEPKYYTSTLLDHKI